MGSSLLYAVVNYWVVEANRGAAQPELPLTAGRAQKRGNKKGRVNAAGKAA
ncbi:MAG: hypothetical protein HC875_35690 [Anaerolineales bacterium]|nr:hypothetical protein [Anaerolineales bacterium]